MTTHLSDRYGSKPARRPLPRAFWYGLAVLGTVLGILFALWVQSADSRKPTGRDVGFSLTSKDEVSVTFEVAKHPDDTAICALKALNSAAAPVGWTEVAIGPYRDAQGNGISVQTVTLRTLSEATTVTVDSCWLANP